MILFQWFKSRVSFFIDLSFVLVSKVNAHNLFVDMPQLIAEIARAFLNPVSVFVSIFGRIGSESAALLTNFRFFHLSKSPLFLRLGWEDKKKYSSFCL